MSILGPHSEKARVGIFRTLDVRTVEDESNKESKKKMVVRVGLCCHGRMFEADEDATHVSIFETCFARLDHASGMHHDNVFTLEVLPICVPFWDYNGISSERVLDTKTYARDLHASLLKVSLAILRWRYCVSCIVGVGKSAGTILTGKFDYNFHRMETKKKKVGSTKNVKTSLKEYLLTSRIPVRVLPHTSHVRGGLLRCSRRQAKRLRSQYDLLLSNTAKFELECIAHTSRTSCQIFKNLHSSTSISKFSSTHTTCVTCNFIRTRMFGDKVDQSLNFETCLAERYSADQWFEALNTSNTKNGNDGVKKQNRRRLAKDGTSLRKLLSEHASTLKVQDGNVDNSKLYRVQSRRNVRVTIVLVRLIFCTILSTQTRTHRIRGLRIYVTVRVSCSVV